MVVVVGDFFLSSLLMLGWVFVFQVPCCCCCCGGCLFSKFFVVVVVVVGVCFLSSLL